MWKGVHIKLYNKSSREFIEVKNQLNAIKKLSLDNKSKDVVKNKYALPIISMATFGPMVVVASPCIPFNEPANDSIKIEQPSNFPIIQKDTVVNIEKSDKHCIEFLIIDPLKLLADYKELRNLLLIPVSLSQPISIFYKSSELKFKESQIAKVLDSASRFKTSYGYLYNWQIQVCSLENGEVNLRANSLIEKNSAVQGNALVACFYTKNCLNEKVMVEGIAKELDAKAMQVNCLSLKEFLHSKGLSIRHEWLLLPYLNNSDTKDLVCIDILLRAVTKLIAKDTILEKYPEYKMKIVKALEFILSPKDINRTKLLEALFFSRLRILNESNINVCKDKKEYLTGSTILKEIVESGKRNPGMLLASMEYLFNIKFDTKVMREVLKDKYFFMKELQSITDKWIASVHLNVYSPIRLTEHTYLELLKIVEANNVFGTSISSGNKPNSRSLSLSETSDIWIPSELINKMPIQSDWLHKSQGELALQTWIKFNSKAFSGLCTVNSSEYILIYSKLLLDLTSLQRMDKGILIEKHAEDIKSLTLVPPELILFCFTVAGVAHECKKETIEAERYYIYSFLVYLEMYGDPRGRGNYCHPWGLFLTYKLKELSQINKRTTDVIFMTELFEIISYFTSKKYFETRLKRERVDVSLSQIMLKIKDDSKDVNLLRPFNEGIAVTRERNINKGWLNWLLVYSPMQNLSGILWDNEHIKELLVPIQKVSIVKSNSSSRKNRSCLVPGSDYYQIFTRDINVLKKNTGFVYVWGADNAGQLGLASQDLFEERKALIPRLCFPLKNEVVRAISCGRSSSFAITLYNTVYAWGLNEYGQLGIGKDTVNVVSYPTRVKGLPLDVKNISSGIEHTMCLMESGEVYSWGNGEGGLLGHGNTKALCEPKLIASLNDIKKIACGGLHTIALSKNGEVYAWGRAEGGQLGLPEQTLKAIMKEKGDYYVDKPMIINTGPLKNIYVVGVSCGEAHTLILDSTAEVYGWGFCNYGQLGLNKTSDCYEPGTGDYSSKVSEPEHVKALSGLHVIEVVAGSTFSLFITNKGEVYGCGLNDFGQTGAEKCLRDLQVFYGSPNKIIKTIDVASPVCVECFSQIKISKLSCGENHVLALSSDPRDLWGWGKYDQGQLGLGEVKNVVSPRIISIFCSVPIMNVK